MLRENWLLLLILIGLIALSVHRRLADRIPARSACARGDRMIMRGESVRWQAVLIELFILAILAMSYNLMFGFTGRGFVRARAVLRHGRLHHRAGAEYTGLDTGIWRCSSGVIGGVADLRRAGAADRAGLAAAARRLFRDFHAGDCRNVLHLLRAPQPDQSRGRLSRSPACRRGSIPSQSRLNYYYLVLALFVGCFLLIRRLINSPTGAVFKAVRENEDRAQAIGYNTLSFKLLSIIARRDDGGARRDAANPAQQEGRTGNSRRGLHGRSAADDDHRRDRHVHRAGHRRGRAAPARHCAARSLDHDRRDRRSTSPTSGGCCSARSSSSSC